MRLPKMRPAFSTLWLTGLACAALSALLQQTSAEELLPGEPICRPPITSHGEVRAEWSEVRGSKGVLAFDHEIVAYIELLPSATTLISRTAPHTNLSPVDWDASTGNLSVRASSTSRTIVLCHRPLSFTAKHISSKQLLNQAAAWELEERADAAYSRADLEAAAQLSKAAFAKLDAQLAFSPLASIEIGFVAIEHLLNVHDLETAIAISKMLEPVLSGFQKTSMEMRVFRDLTHARILAFRGEARRALNIRLALQPEIEKRFGSISPISLWNRFRIANLLLEQHDPVHAKQTLLALIDAITPLQSVPSPLSIATQLAFANALALSGYDQDSLQQLYSLKNLLIASFGDNDRRVIDVTAQIARAELRLGKFDSAQLSLSSVFLWRYHHFGFSNFLTLESAWLLARIYNSFGRYETAHALISEVLNTLDVNSMLGTDAFKQNALGTLASIQANQGNFESSENIWLSVAGSFARISSTRADDYLGAMLNYSLVAIFNHHEKRACQALSMLRHHSAKKISSDIRTEGFASLLIGFCETYTHKNAAFDAGLARIDAVCVTIQHFDGAGSDSSLTCLSILAALAIRGHRHSAAIAYLRRLIQEAEGSPNARYLDVRQRGFWQAKWIGASSGLSGYATLARLLAKEGDLVQALEVSELTRSRIFDAHLQSMFDDSASSDQSNTDDASLLETRFAVLDNRLARSPDLVERVELECERSLLNRLILNKDKAALTRSSESHVKASAVKRYDFSQIPDEVAIVSLHHSDGEWWGIVATKLRGLKLLQFERSADISPLAKAWLSSTKGFELKAWQMIDGSISIDFSKPRLSTGTFLSTSEIEDRLQARLVEPLVAALHETRTIAIVADDDLLDIPFGALRYRGQYLISRFDFTYAPSVALAISRFSTKARRNWEFDLFALADENDRSHQISSYADRPSSAADVNSSVKESSSSFQNLRFAPLEVEHIAGNFPESDVLVFRDGTEGRRAMLAASADGSLRSFKFVHLTAHVSNASGFADGRYLAIGSGITATELSHMRMGSELIVLSGCGTAIGPYLPGQGMLGLGVAALAAGNTSALLTLWEIPDDLSDEFMKLFYRFLASGSAPYEALGYVQRRFVDSQNRRMQDPRVWGAFVLFGQL